MRPSRGFTLIEILLAMALLAVGMGLAFSALRTASGSVARAERMAAETEQVRSAQRFLRRQITSALPMVFERNEQTGFARIVLGEEDRLSFVATMPGHLSRGGPHLQLVELVPDRDRGRDGYRLEFSYQILVGEQPVDVANPRPPVILVDGIAEGGFEFRGMDDEGEISGWEPSWDRASQMPILARLELRFIDERRFWPPLAMAMPLAHSARFQDELIPGPTPGPGGGRGRGRGRGDEIR